MARTFTKSSNQWLKQSTAILTAAPISMAAWFKLNSLTADMVIIGITGTNKAFDVVFYTSDKKIRAEAVGGTDDDTAACNVVLTTGTWYHGCGVFASATSRSCYLNGGNKATSVVNETPSPLSATAVAGSSNTGGPFSVDGIVAWPAIWQVALTDADVASLANGAHPTCVQPGQLAAALNLTGGYSPEPDFVNTALTWSLQGSPVESVNPRIYRRH